MRIERKSSGGSSFAGLSPQMRRRKANPEPIVLQTRALRQLFCMGCPRLGAEPCRLAAQLRKIAIRQPERMRKFGDLADLSLAESIAAYGRLTAPPIPASLAEAACDLAEACRMLRVNHRCAWLLMESGVISEIVTADRLLFSRASIERFISNCQEVHHA